MNEEYMKRALDLALKGLGEVHPNPLVGATIVKNGEVIGEGYHKKYGLGHAEVEAFNNCKVSPEGADMYITLEPCSHYGKTPPCADLIVKKKIKRVYIGMLDPNPLVSGNGVNILKDAGIEVHVGLLSEACQQINKRFVKYITTSRPYVIYKSAMTLDGKTQASDSSSKWITGGKSREYVHKLRGVLKGIMVGANTVLVDNPSLTNRGEIGNQPARIILDEKLEIPLDAKVYDQQAETIVFTSKVANQDKVHLLVKKCNVKVITVESSEGKLNLEQVIDSLGMQKIDAVLLEGGPTLAFSMLERHLIDEVNIFIAPKLIGGTGQSVLSGIGFEGMVNAIEVSNVTVRQFGNDFMLKGDVNYLYRNN